MNTTVTDRPAAGNEQRPPDWWHRDHPTFTALTGFFTGLAFVALVPALFVGLLMGTAVASIGMSGLCASLISSL